MKNQNETWRDIPNYEGIYQVSNLGQVRSLDRIVSMRSPQNIRSIKGKFMKPFIEEGYKRLCLTKNGKKRKLWVHRLVAMAFIPNPNNLPEINHIDENPANNHVDNLEWCDRLYNIHYGTRTERMAISQGCSVEQLTLQGDVINTFYSFHEAARAIGNSASASAICAVCRGRFKSYYGFKWRYKHGCADSNKLISGNQLHA